MPSVKKEIIPLLQDFTPEVMRQMEAVLEEWRMRVATSAFLNCSKAVFLAPRSFTCRIA